VILKRRNKTYQTNQSREALISQYESYDDYIAAFEIKIVIHEALPKFFFFGLGLFFVIILNRPILNRIKAFNVFRLNIKPPETFPF
jgi:hypothetical protein